MDKAIYEKIIDDFGQKAKRENWALFYDSEDDCLYWTKGKIPRTAKLAQLSREVSFYLDKRGTANGVMIQYFRNNFLNHNKELSDIKKFIKKDVIVSKKTKELDTLLGWFAESIAKDIYKEAAKESYTVKDLEKVLVSASA